MGQYVRCGHVIVSRSAVCTANPELLANCQRYRRLLSQQLCHHVRELVQHSRPLGTVAQLPKALRP